MVWDGQSQTYEEPKSAHTLHDTLDDRAQSTFCVSISAAFFRAAQGAVTLALKMS
jgi:hypothetical protein